MKRAKNTKTSEILLNVGQQPIKDHRKLNKYHMHITISHKHQHVYTREKIMVRALVHYMLLLYVHMLSFYASLLL